MSDLAARLVHDAAEAIDDVDGGASSVEPCGDATYSEMARAAVVAVLEALAEHAAPIQDDENMWPTYDDLHRLAERVKEARRHGMGDYLIVNVRISIPLPDDNLETWPEERCQKHAEEVAGDIAADWRAQLVDWCVTS